MATAEELLAAETGTNKVLTIDSDLRTITIPSGFGVFGVESDDNVHCVHFRGPRYYHEVDLSTFRLRVNIANAKGEEDSYPVTDMAAEGDTITFSWLIGRFAAQYKGDIKFSLCFKEIDSEGITTREFNTTTATGRILEGLETGEAVVQEYPDVLEGILLRLESLEENGIPAGSLDTTLSVSGKAADAKAVGDAIASISTSGGSGVERLVVTATMSDDSSGTASHSSTQIIEHLNAGGDVILKLMPTNIYAELTGVVGDQVIFDRIGVTANTVAQRGYCIYEDAAVSASDTVSVAGLTEEQAAQIQANTDAIEALPIKIADDGYTDISGIRQLTNFSAIKEDNVVTLNYTLQGDKHYTDIIELDADGRPTKITTPHTSFDVTWEGF